MDHKAFLASLPAADRAALSERADRPGLLRLALHLGLIAALAALVGAGAPLWPLLVPVLGLALAFLFTLQHECTHKTPFATPLANEAAGHLAGLLVFQPFIWFRYFHLAHHRFTNDPARDPELVGAPKPETWGEFARHLLALGYWRDKAAVLLSHAFGAIEGDYVPDRARPGIRLEARAMLAVYALAAVFTAFDPILFWIWLLPLAFGFPALRLYLLAEHGRCPAVANMFDNTRTTLTTRAVRFIAWNMPYHAEHHVMPAAPFHRLPALHRRAREHLSRVSEGYAAFARDYAAGLKGDGRPIEGPAR